MCIQFFVTQILRAKSKQVYVRDRVGNLYAYRNPFPADDFELVYSKRSRKYRIRFYRDYWQHEACAIGSKVRDDIEADIKAGTVIWSIA